MNLSPRQALGVLAVAAIPALTLLSFRSMALVPLALWVAAFPKTLLSWDWLRRVPRWQTFLMLLMGYAALTILWSPARRASDGLIYLPIALAAPGLFLHGTLPRLVFLGSVAAAIALLLADAVTGNALRQLIPPDQTQLDDMGDTGRGLTLAMVLLPAAGLIAYRRAAWRIARGFILLAGIAAASTPTQLNGAMLLGGLAAMAITAAMPKVGLKIVLGLVGFALAMPFMLAAWLPSQDVLADLPGLPLSFVHRLIIWRTVLDSWLTGDVLFGAGVRSTELLMSDEGRMLLRGSADVVLVSYHPHNAAIEILYETGLVGYGLLLATYVTAVQALLRAPMARDMRAAAASLIMVSTLLFSFDYTIWSEYVPCTVLLAAFALRHASAVGQRPLNVRGAVPA